MESVMVVIDVVQGSQEWLEWRKSGVTATCAPVLMGAHNAKKTVYELYLNYVGLLAPEDLSVIRQVHAGNVNEPLARAYAESKLGQFSLPLCVQHRDFPHMIASLDAIFEDNHLLEIKNLSNDKHLEILTHETDSPEFQYYYWQVQHQLFCTGSPGAYLLFWSAKDEPKFFFIKPNLVIHAELLKRSTEFYEQVKMKKAPVFDKDKDVLLISDANVIQQTSGFSLPHDLNVRVEVIRKAAASLEAAKAEVERLEALTKANISGLAGALGFKPDNPVRFDGYGIRYLESAAKGGVSWKKIVAKLLPDLNLEDHKDCFNDDKIITKLTTYEYMPTVEDSIVVKVPEPGKPSNAHCSQDNGKTSCSHDNEQIGITSEQNAVTVF